MCESVSLNHIAAHLSHCNSTILKKKKKKNGGLRVSLPDLDSSLSLCVCDLRKHLSSSFLISFCPFRKMGTISK